MLTENEIEQIHADTKKAFRGRERVAVRFHRPRDGQEGLALDVVATRERGYPVYQDEIWCKRFVDEDNIMDGPILTYKAEHEYDTSPFNDFHSKVSKHHCDDENGDFRKIWPREWAAFERGDKEQIVGFRLESFFVSEPSRVQIWKHFGIRTVESLANISDETAKKVLGGVEDRQKARDALDVIKGMRPIAEINAQQGELVRENQILKEQMTEMSSMMAEMQKVMLAQKQSASEAKPKRGRPSKKSELVDEVE